MDGDIIALDVGWNKVKAQGIVPFIDFIETTDKEFFKAKDFVTLYDLIFKMCIQREPYNWSEAMYNNYTDSILGYLRDVVTKKLHESQKSDFPEEFLKEWKTRWLNQTKVVKGLSKLFMYLDRFYTITTDGVLKLEEQGYKQFKDNIFEHFCERAKADILRCIEKERDGEQQDRMLLKEAIQVFVGIGYNYNNQKLTVYEEKLQTSIVEDAGVYHRRKAREWLDQDACPTYLKKAEKVINQEIDRVESYMNRVTLDPLVRECYLRLLKDHQEELLDKQTGVEKMLSDNATEDLSRMYNLYQRYPSDLDLIAKKVHDHIKKAGETVVNNASPQKGGSSADANHMLVKELIKLHAQYNDVVKTCFGGSQVFQKALKRAFEDFINQDNRVSKLLAKFVNDVLKKGTKINVSSLEETLDNVVFLYGYIQEKDIFERDYQLFLQTRLLKGQCESEHSEKSMIAKLKSECGYQWTNKLEGMFKDVQLSKELGEKFKADNRDIVSKYDFNFDVTVCRTGFWPSSKVIKCLMPDVLKPPAELFRKFYLGMHSGRKLEWRMDQGQAEVSVAFAKGVKRGLVCTPYQMMIMLLFATNKKVVTYQEMVDMTGIPKYEIANHILSLCHPKVAVLLKRPNTKELEDNHKFMINSKFNSTTLQVQIPLMKTQVNPEKEGQEEHFLRVQRNHQIDAAVVRIMKSRQRLKHNQLVTEVVAQIGKRFKPKMNNIKKRIEALIEQDYLERDANDRSMYNYLA